MYVAIFGSRVTTAVISYVIICLYSWWRSLTERIGHWIHLLWIVDSFLHTHVNDGHEVHQYVLCLLDRVGWLRAKWLVSPVVHIVSYSVQAPVSAEFPALYLPNSRHSVPKNLPDNRQTASTVQDGDAITHGGELALGSNSPQLGLVARGRPRRL